MVTAQLLDGRKWEKDASGKLTALTRRYQIVRDDVPAGTAAEEAAAYAGLPGSGAAHPSNPNLRASKFSFSEGEGTAKRMLYCEVSYTSEGSDKDDANKAPAGQAIEKLGWKSGSVSRDLVRDAGTGKLLLNTAGQPFDSVPQVDVPAPTFEKVFKVTARKDWIKFFGQINAAPLTVGGKEFAKHCVRCVQVDEERLWNDEFGFKYRYSIGLQVMTNVVEVEGNQQAEEIGWDLAVVSTGTMERAYSGAAVSPVKAVSSETGKEVFVSSPVLLDANGKALTEPSAKPYAIRVQAYPDATFPEDFTSEPAN